MFRYSEHVYQFPIHHQRARPSEDVCSITPPTGSRSHPIIIIPRILHLNSFGFLLLSLFPHSLECLQLSRKELKRKRNEKRPDHGSFFLTLPLIQIIFFEEDRRGSMWRMPATLTFPAATHPHLANSQTCQRSIWRQFHRIFALPHFFCLLPVFSLAVIHRSLSSPISPHCRLLSRFPRCLLSQEKRRYGDAINENGRDGQWRVVSIRNPFDFTAAEQPKPVTTTRTQW